MSSAHVDRKQELVKQQIVLIPGTESAGAKAFRGLRPLLERDYTVHVFDYTSASGLEATEQVDHYVDQIRSQLVESSCEHPVHVLGYSLGAHVALHYAARFGEAVESLTLISGWLSPSPYQSERHDLWMDLYDGDPAMAGRLSHVLQYSPSYLRHLSLLQTPVAMEPGVPGEEIRRRVMVNREVDSTAAANEVSVPTLIIHGTEDLKVPSSAAYELSGQICDARLAFVVGGHALLSEKLGEVYGHFHDFLKGGIPSESVLTPMTV